MAGGASEEVPLVRSRVPRVLAILHLAWPPLLMHSKLLRWYNVPPTNNKQNLYPSSSGLSATAASSGTQNQLTTDEINSAPLNFDTFVPTHDPSLIPAVPPHAAAPGQDHTAYSLPNPPGSIVSQDEAFSRALAAMYWGGYWTAIYHVSGYGASFIWFAEYCMLLYSAIVICQQARM